MANRLWKTMVLCLLAGLVARDCDCSGPNKGADFENCIDLDGDGYGADCMLGDDCDDEDPNLNYSCDCAVVPHQGCPCVDGEEEECFEAAEVFLGVGPCRAGKRSCVQEEFTTCVGQVLPEPERCDNIDNDCDGTADEDLTCTDCGARCTAVEIGPGSGQEFELDQQENRGLEKDPDGNLILEQGEHIRFTFLYVANSDEGTVSKIDTETGQEVARYLSALFSPDARNRGTADASGNEPSRTAVDFNGDVWVANRASGKQGTVTKIAHRDCPDLNGNSEKDTSHDANGDGHIDLSDPAEFLGEADECILFTVNVGGVGGIPRAVALDAGGIEGGPGRAWVGCYGEDKFYQLDAEDGHVLAEVGVGLHPYGAAIDSWGVLWATQQATGKIVSVDTNNHTAGEVIQIADCSGSYGIAVDLKGRVWVGGYKLEGACSYDPATGSSLLVSTPGLGVGRGIAADAEGYVWLAHSWLPDGTKLGRVTRFKAEDGSELRSYDFPAGSQETIGVGVDFDGFIWGVNRDSDNTCRVDPDSGAVDCYPVGNGPYTYSDFTGFALRNFTAPRGTYQQLFEGCGLPTTTRWKQISWEATVPPGTQVKIYVTAADTEAGLATAERYGPFDSSPVDLIAAGDISGQFLLVEVVLSTDEDGLTPIFKGIGVQRICSGED